MDKITFQPRPYELIDGLLDPGPVLTVVFQHTFIDRQTSVHLEIQDSFRLFIGEEAVLHEPGNEIFLGQLAESVQEAGGGDLIKEKNTVFRIFLYLLTERIGASCLFRAHHMVVDLCGVLYKYVYNIVQHIVQIIIMKIKSSPVNF